MIRDYICIVTHKTVKYIKICTIIKINLLLKLLYIYIYVFLFSYLEKIAYHKTADIISFIKGNSRIKLLYKSLFLLHMYIYNIYLLNKYLNDAIS